MAPTPGPSVRISIRPKAVAFATTSSASDLLPGFILVDHREGRGPAFGLSVGVGVGRSQTTDDLIDLNGDGLPDRVRRDGDTVKVALNLGRRFGVEEDFGQLDAAVTGQHIEPADLLL